MNCSWSAGESTSVTQQDGGHVNWNRNCIPAFNFSFPIFIDELLHLKSSSPSYTWCWCCVDALLPQLLRASLGQGKLTQPNLLNSLPSQSRAPQASSSNQRQIAPTRAQLQEHSKQLSTIQSLSANRFSHLSSYSRSSHVIICWHFRAKRKPLPSSLLLL